MFTVVSVARFVVLAVFLGALFAGGASWLVRTRRVSPFGPLGRFLRGASDPIMRPVETRLVRMGGHPGQASFWLIMVAAVGGILLISLLDWLARLTVGMQVAFAGGIRGVLAFSVRLTYSILIVALIVRVVGQWFGVGRYTPWMRPAYWLTDWVVEPLRRVVPPFGPFDITPLVAWLLLWLLRQFMLVILL